jgi:hypothetical protein
LVVGQRDKIGRIFTFWAIVNCRQFLENYRSSQKFWGYFFDVKILKRKMGGATIFGATFSTLKLWQEKWPRLQFLGARYFFDVYVFDKKNGRGYNFWGLLFRR